MRSSLFVKKLSILKSWFLLRNRPVTLSKSRKRQHRSSSFEGDSTASLGTHHYYGLYPETKHIKMQWNDPATMAYSLKQLPVKHKKMQWNDSATIAYTLAETNFGKMLLVSWNNTTRFNFYGLIPWKMQWHDSMSSYQLVLWRDQRGSYCEIIIYTGKS